MRKGERRVSRTGPWNPHPCAENAQGWGTPGTRSLNPSLARVLPSFARLPRRGRLGLRGLWVGPTWVVGWPTWVGPTSAALINDRPAQRPAMHPHMIAVGGAGSSGLPALDNG